MRIAIVLPRGSVMCRDKANSMETVVRTLTAHSRFKASVKIICDAGAAMPDAPDMFDIERVPAGLSRSKRNDAVVAILRAYDPDHIEYHQQLKASAIIASRLPGKTHVLHRHTRIKPPGGAVEAMRYRMRLARFDQLLFVSEAAGREFIADYPGFANRVAAICNPIDVEAWRGCPETREKLILFSGRALPEKGMDLFCNALAETLDQRPDWRGALMLGDWEKHEAWAQPHIDALARFGDRVEIHRSAGLPEVMAVTKRAAIAVTPSLVAEAMGLVALEAHAAGAALISSGRGGLKEASGANALYVNPPTSPDLKGAMAYMIDNEAMRIEMAQAGQAFVAATHSPQIRSGQLDDLRDRLAMSRTWRRARMPQASKPFAWTQAVEQGFGRAARLAAAFVGKPAGARLPDTAPTNQV